jgi:hypothetical protein
MYRPNHFMYYGLSSATGSQKFVLDPYARLVSAVGIDDVLLRMGGVLAPLLDARYLITRSPQPEGSLELRAEAGGLLLYRLEGEVPHAFFPADVQAVGSPEEAVDRTRANVNPLAVAVVETAGSPPAAGAGTARVAHYEPDEIALDVESERAGLLVVSEIHHPGWRAYVDGSEVEIWRANAAFRGVVVPAGAHSVRFVYGSAAYALGGWLSILSAASLAVALTIFTFWGRRARNRPASS